MIVALSRKVIVGIAAAVAVFWTLSIALIYALMSSTDDLWRWTNGLMSVPPELARAITDIGSWLGQFGGGLLLVVWALGLALLVGLALVGRRLTELIPKLQRAGGLS